MKNNNWRFFTMTIMSHLRLVFVEPAGPTIDNLVTMKNPGTGEDLFDKESIISGPGKPNEVRSNPVPFNIAAAAPAVIKSGEFPYLETYIVVSFDGEAGVHGQAAGMRVLLRQKANSEKEAAQFTESIPQIGKS